MPRNTLKFRFLIWKLSVLVTVGLPHGASATQLHVPAVWPTIQMALDSCASGDTVLVAPGHYHERLVVPNKSLTLGSQTLISEDTLYIQQTIIDGDSLGSVITVMADSLHQVVIDGFNIHRGIGDDIRSGGIQAVNYPDIIVRNILFSHNWSSTYLCAAKIFANRLTTSRLRFHSNHNQYRPAKTISLRSLNRTIASDVIFSDVDECLGYITSSDSLIVSDVYILNISTGNNYGLRLGPSADGAYAEIRDITISNSRFNGQALLLLGGGASGSVRNIQLLNNQQVSIRSGHSVLAAIGAYDIDTLVFRGNRGLVKGGCAGEVEIYRGPLQEWAHGNLRHLVLENNQLGDSLYTDWDGSNYPTMLYLHNMCLDGASIRNNRITLTPGSGTPEWGETDANLIKSEHDLADSISFVNVAFVDNIVDDRDDYPNMTDVAANLGRCLIINSDYYLDFYMDNCVFENNRQPNRVEEGPSMGWLSYDNLTIGSLITLRGNNSNPNYSRVKRFSNLVFRDNDDGGITATSETDLVFRNVAMLNMSRQALNLDADSIRLENVLIDGCTPFASLQTRSEQMPLRFKKATTALISNCTVMNCTTPYVVMAGQTPRDEPRVPVIHFENTLFWNNQYDEFEAEVAEFDWPGWDSFRPGRFDYCELPLVPSYGANNLINTDPHFDPDRHAPYLAPDSPCIDAGDPDPFFNDAEDPANHGFALWPGLGTLRGDIGFTGGPHAVLAPDSSWSALRPWEPRLPHSFTLGEPWPNPFNPVTQIPVELARPSLVHLVVHNVLGQQITVLNDGLLPAGRRAFRWEAQGQASGLYFISMQVDLDKAQTRAVTLLR